MYYIGIDLGGTGIKAGLVNENGKILNKDSIPTHREKGYEGVIKDMAELSLKVMKDAGVDVEDVCSIGIGIPGVVDNGTGNVLYAHNVDFNDIPLRDEMRKYINLPVMLDNDANCAALAEYIDGAAKGVNHSITITLGTGIGGGIVINKKIYSGFNGAAAEIGHMVIVSEGEICGCGKKGCWEAYASATAIIRETRKAARNNPESLINSLVGGDLSKVNAKTAFDADRQGDETGKKVVAQYIKYLATGLANLINILQPEVVVIGGGMSKEGEYLLNPLREIVRKRVHGSGEIGLAEAKIKAAEMGNDAGIIGAAMLGKE